MLALVEIFGAGKLENANGKSEKLDHFRIHLLQSGNLTTTNGKSEKLRTKARFEDLAGSSLQFTIDETLVWALLRSLMTCVSRPARIESERPHGVKKRRKWTDSQERK